MRQNIFQLVATVGSGSAKHVGEPGKIVGLLEK